MISFSSDAYTYYKVVLKDTQTDSPIQSVFIHTHSRIRSENYIVFALARHIKHSNSIAEVFSFVYKYLPDIKTKIITWTPPALQSSQLGLKAPLCIEVDHNNARNAIKALFKNRVISKSNYMEICSCLQELEKHVL